MRSVLFVFFYFSLSLSIAQEYDCLIDLTEMQNDRVPVEIRLDSFDISGEIEYHMPKMVPGTYSISNFGRLISDFSVFDLNGNEIESSRLDLNRWKISSADSIDLITYWVDDTFDDEQYSDIFEPGGTNIEENNFLINAFGFLGFLENHEKRPYSITVKHPRELYGASPLSREILSDDKERFRADNYFQLSDSPIMYSPPDTSSVMIDDTKVMVSVYSPSKDSVAEIMMESIEPTLKAQGEYLGGNLPVKSYVILIYMHENPTNSGAMGALEHSYSTVFSYPDIDPVRLARSIVDVTSHEFFHIITPLTIHSEEIGDYSFSDPKMSKHLWLYEGVTEYSSMRVQVMYDLITVDDYLDEIIKKMKSAERYNDSLPFTEMSLGALDVYKDQYTNVYSKGALIGMCLDLLLLQHSNGEYDIRALLSELSERYGLEKSFKDAELFDEISEMTYPEIRAFFARYVEGPEPLPIEECLNYAGAQYLFSDTVYENTLGNAHFGYDAERSALAIVDISSMNDFGIKMGFKVGDIIYKINGVEMTLSNYYEVMGEFYKLNEGEKIEIEVIRMKGGKERYKKLKSKVQRVPVILNRRIEWMDSPSERQLNVRNSWLNKMDFIYQDN